MAGIIKNTIVTEFTSKGANKVEKDTDRIGRAQTRLGQASASNSRQFAAQASGLGGLVAAYAGAAATVFALEAAFTALAQAAAAENIVKGTSALARETGQVGNQILENIKRVTDGQLALAESAEIANLALSAGFNTDQINELIVGANKASKALGRDLTDSITRVVRGTAKLEPELLDELGLFVRIDSAAAAYARQIGKTANSLTEFERRQAFLIAAQTQLETKFGNIDTSSASAQKSFEQLAATVADLSKDFGQFVANILVPLVDLFKQPGNQILLFGGILALVFGKARELVGSWALESIGNITKFADTLAIKAQAAKGNLKVIEDAQVNLNKAIEQRGGLAADGGRFSQVGVSRDIAVESARARAAFLAGGVSPADQKKAIDILKVAQKQLAAQGLQTSAAFKDADVIIKSYTASLAKASTSTKVLTRVSQGLTRVANGLTTAFNFAGKAINGLFLIVSVAQLVGTIFDIDILQKIKGLFVDLSQETANLKDGIQAVFTVSGDPSSLTEQLKLLGGSDKDIEDIGQTAKSLFDQIDIGGDKVRTLRNSFVTLGDTTIRDLAALNEALDKLKIPKIEVPGIVIDSNIDSITVSAYELQQAIDKIRSTNIPGFFNRNVQTAADTLDRTFKNLVDSATELPQGMSVQGRTVGNVVERGVDTLDQLAIAQLDYAKELRNSTQLELAAAEAAGKNTTELKIRAFLLDNFIKNTERYGLGIAQLAGDLGRVLEIPASQILEAFDNDLIGLTKNTADAFTLLGVTIQRDANTGALSIANLNKEQKELIATTVSTILSIKDLDDSIAAGTATSDRLSGAIVGYSRTLKLANAVVASLGDSYESSTELIEDAAQAQERYDTAVAQRDALKNKIDDFIKLRDALTKIEAQYKGLTSTFSAEIKFGSTAAFQGLIDAQGQFARNDREQQENRLNLLGNLISGYRDSAQAVRDYNAEVAARPGEDVEFTFTKSLTQATREAEVFDTTLQAIAGTIFNIYQETEKLRKELENIIQNRQIELTILDQELDLLNLRNSLELQALRDENRLASAERKLSLAQTELETQGQILDLIRDQADAALQLAENKTQPGISPAQTGVADLRLGQIKEEVSALVLQLDEGQLRSAAQLYQQAIENASKATGENIAAAQIKVLDAEKGLQEAYIAKQLEIFDQETQLQLAKISADADALAREAELLNEQASLDKLKLAGERLIAEQNAATTKAQLEGYREFVRGVNGFADIVSELARVFQSYIDALPDVEGTIASPNFTKITEESINAAIGAADTAAELQSQVFDRQNDLINKQLEGALAKNAEKLAELGRKYGDVEAQRAAERAQLELELTASAQETNNEIANLGSTVRGTGAAAKEVEGRLKDLTQSYKSAFSSAFSSLYDYIINGGEEGESFGDRLKTAFGKLLSDIATSIVDTAIIDPISNFLANKLSSFLSDRLTTDIMGDPLSGPLGGITKDTTAAATADANAAAAASAALSPDTAVSNLGTQVQTAGSQAVAQINSTAQQLDGALKQLGFGAQQGSGTASAQISGAGTQLQGAEQQLGTQVQQGASIATPQIVASGTQQATAQTAAGVAIGTAGATASSFIVSAIQMLLPFLLILGITKLFSRKKASGGLVHMALGGAVKQLASGGMLRDRVPALLEPGEFVIRRPAAKALGAPALQQMNATGKTPGGGAPIINIINKGTPQEAQAEQPRFDGERYIIDIVTKDIQNNGPIRKSLRGG